MPARAAATSDATVAWSRRRRSGRGAIAVYFRDLGSGTVCRPSTQIIHFVLVTSSPLLLQAQDGSSDSTLQSKPIDGPLLQALVERMIKGAEMLQDLPRRWQFRDSFLKEAQHGHVSHARQFYRSGNSQHQGHRQAGRGVSRLAQKHGANVRNFYWTLGQYDCALIIEAPDDAVVTTLAPGAGALGNVRTQVLRIRGRRNPADSGTHVVEAG